MAAPETTQDHPTPAASGTPAGATAPGSLPPTRGEAKRKHARHTVEITVDVYEIGEGGVPVRHWSCKTSDLSRGGIGLSSDRMVHLGRLLLLTMPGAAGGPRKVMCGVVRSTEYEAGHGHTLGVEFTAIPDGRPLEMWRRDNGLLDAA